MASDVRIMLAFDSRRMPLDTPEIAEMMNPTVSTAMIEMSRALPTSSIPVTSCTPAPIWVAASPRAAAVPKRVAKMASMSMSRPIQEPLTSVPNSGAKIEEISETRPRRYME